MEIIALIALVPIVHAVAARPGRRPPPGLQTRGPSGAVRPAPTVPFGNEPSAILEENGTYRLPRIEEVATLVGRSEADVGVWKASAMRIVGLANAASGNDRNDEAPVVEGDASSFS